MSRAVDYDPLWLTAIALKEVPGGIGMTEYGPVIRIEPHYWRRYAPGKYKDIKISQPRSQAARYKVLAKLRKLDDTAALMSISMGKGQVMGANHAMIGYSSVQGMWRAAHTDAGQDYQMAEFIRAKGIDELLASGLIEDAAYRYNGPKYRLNNWAYDVVANYRRLGGTGPVVTGDKAFRPGSAGRGVMRLQRGLRKLGYRLLVDGIYGQQTEQAVRSFQAGYGIAVDGIAGKQTMSAIADVLDSIGEELPTDREAATVADVKRVSRTARAASSASTVTGTLAAGTAALTAANEFGYQAAALGPSVVGVIEWLTESWQGLALVGLCVAWYLSRKILDYRVADHRSGDSL